MNQLTGKELLALNWGDRVTMIKGIDHRNYRFVGLMPGMENAAILCKGTDIIYHYVSKNEEDRLTPFYSGKYDSRFVGEKLIKEYHSRLAAVRELHFKED